MGPYESEADAATEPMPEEITRLHRANMIRSGDPDHLARDTMWRHMTGACEQAGVELGAYDRSILQWLCGWEPETVQVVIGLVSRAHAAGPGGR